MREKRREKREECERERERSVRERERSVRVVTCYWFSSWFIMNICKVKITIIK